MEPFCANPECPGHKFSVKPDTVIITMGDMNVMQNIKRSQFSLPDGTRIKFCEICMAAIEMTL